jgi:hypothetical protein
MDSKSTLSTEMLQQIQNFVDQIDQVLIERGVPRIQRNNICDEVESQIQLLIDRRLQSGVELNSDLVTSTIESMDQPDSYRQSIDAGFQPDYRSSATGPENPHQPKSNSYWKRCQIAFSSFFAKHLGKESHTHLLAVAGLVLSGLGGVQLPLGIVIRSEAVTVFGLLLLFLGALTSGIAFWRIRNSNKHLLGQKYSSVGILISPFLFGNMALAAFLAATRLGLVLGVLAVVALIAFCNYKLFRRALRWLERSPERPFATHSQPSSAPAGQLDPSEIDIRSRQTEGLAGI